MSALVGVFITAGCFVIVVAIFFRLADLHADVKAIRRILEAAS